MFVDRPIVPVAQWLRRVTTNHEIGGSSPSGNAFLRGCDRVPIHSTQSPGNTSTRGLVGYDARLTRERSPVRSRAGVLLAYTVKQH